MGKSNTLLVVVVNFSTEQKEFHGLVTNRLYGYVKNGHVFPMAREDYKNDKRVAKATQDTLRMFA